MAGDWIGASGNGDVDVDKCNGKNTQEVSSLLKGASGTDLTIKVKRGNEILSFDLTRAKIIIKNVPYHGIVKDNIGYIKLTEFTTDAAKEVKNALVELIAMSDCTHTCTYL